MRKSEIPGRATIVRTRRRAIMIISAFLLFLSFLVSNLFKLQYVLHSYYKEKVYDQITTTSILRAERGNIYDSNMNPLAITNTSWRIFISTKDIKRAEKEKKHPYARIISEGLAEILTLDKDYLSEKIMNSNVLDVTVKKNATKEEYEAVLNFAKQNDLESLIFVEAQSSRYYPEQTLAAHLLGFCGSDNQGLYGIEYYYDDWLRGKDGYYLYAKDANGNALNTDYSTYIPSKAGCDIISTIDSYVQRELESQLESAVRNHAVTNRATGIVMDVKTGAILAMATSSPFNPNNPYILDDLSMNKLISSGLSPESKEYKSMKKDLLETMWSNKAVSETYEPGSTFKIITVSAALDSGVADMNDRFNCIGYYPVGGWRIRCHKITGHGSGISLAYGLQMSCNPTMMQLSERIGSENFYKYVKDFGYLSKSGIDLPSEAGSIFHSPQAIGPTELATASFGQRFKVSIINHLTAIAAVANGGEIVTPYVVSKIVDKDGNIVYERDTEIKRRVISSEVAAAVNKVLSEGVSGDGGAKNARVDGYEIAAKTGTSQKFDILDENGNSYLRIGSTVGYNISDDGGIATIIVVDEPQSTVKYGSVVAAPYVSALLTNILPYLGYESSAVTEEKEIPNLVGEYLKSAEKILKEKNLNYEIVGDGEFIVSQSPTSDDTIYNTNSKIILYTTEEISLLTVPNLVGKEVSAAVSDCMELGLNIKLCGSIDGGTVVNQSLPMGARVSKGSIIELNVLVCDYED